MHPSVILDGTFHFVGGTILFIEVNLCRYLTLSLPLLSYLVLLLDSLLVRVIVSRILWEAEQESPPVLRGNAGVGSLSLSRGLYLDDLVLNGLASGDRCFR